MSSQGTTIAKVYRPVFGGRRSEDTATLQRLRRAIEALREQNRRRELWVALLILLSVVEFAIICVLAWGF